MYSRSLMVLLLSISSIVQAGTEQGGVIITYKSLASVTGNLLSYVVEASMIYDTSATPATPTSINIDVSSSCFIDANHVLPMIGNPQSVISDYCDPLTSDKGNYEIAIYRDTITLPGVCSDFNFSYTSNGIWGAFNTINLGPFNAWWWWGWGTSNTYSQRYNFSISLDNTLGPNNSPTLPEDNLFQVGCLDTSLSLYSFNEVDGDSVYYTSSVPKVRYHYSSFLGSYDTVGNGYYHIPYTRQNQVGSKSGFSVNAGSGALQTSINSPGTYIITIRFQEYRKDSLGVPVEIGDGRFSMVVVGDSNCVLPPAKIKHRSMPNSELVDCGSDSLIFAVNRRLSKLTVLKDSLDFLVFDANGPVAVSGAKAISDTIIQINLVQPVAAGLDLFVTIDTNTPGHIMSTLCGNQFDLAADTLVFTPTGNSNLQASFTHTSNLLAVNFNASGSNGDSVLWNFNDGSPPSGIISPTHIYSAPGIYSVLLRAFDYCGGEDSSKQVITICDSLYGSFSANISGDTVVLITNLNGASFINWNLGDGSVDTGSSVTHVYGAPGIYYVEMTVLNGCGDTIILGDTVITCLPTISSWTHQVISAGAGGIVVDFDATGSTADSVLWDFGDGSPPSGLISPTHVYATSGTYKVQLGAFDNCGGQDSLSQTITICDSLIASFHASVNGDTVLLSSTVTGASQISWDFGDGTTGSGSVVSHYYAIPGLYYVQMTVVNICSDTLMIGDTVKVCLDPISSFTALVISTSGAGMVVDFDGTASVGATSWLWEFGDGATDATTLTPTHTYQTPGLQYQVSLTIANSCGDTVSYAHRLNEIGLAEFGESISIYPNPASDFIKLDFKTSISGPIGLSLTNSVGQKLWSRQLDLVENPNLTIPVDQLPRGWYLLQVTHDQESGQQVLILE